MVQPYLRPSPSPKKGMSCGRPPEAAAREADGFFMESSL